MKKALFMVYMAVILTATQALAGIVIKTTLTIGRKNNNCSGFGLCSVSTSTAYTSGYVNGTLDVNVERGSIILGILENDIKNLQPDKMTYFTNKSTVVFAEDFQMSNEIKEAVQVNTPLKIKKGEYDMTYKNGKYFIEIPL
ncbi:MAG: hypothetical protein ACOH2V_12965 [Candidatus Saccharimonadaceae bacterium]